MPLDVTAQIQSQIPDVPTPTKDNNDFGARQDFTYEPNTSNPNSSVDVTNAQTVILHINGDTNQVGVWPATSLRISNATKSNVNINNSGLGGLDTGTKANNTDYYLYCISDGTNYNYVWSANVNFPVNTSFSTYIYAAYCGWNHTDGSGNFLKIRKTNYEYSFPLSGANIPIIASSSNSGVATAVNISGVYVAPQTQKVRCLLVSSTASTSVSVCKNNTSPIPDGLITQGSTGLLQHQQVTMMLESGYLYYKSTDSAAKLYLLGFENTF